MVKKAGGLRRGANPACRTLEGDCGMKVKGFNDAERQKHLAY